MVCLPQVTIIIPVYNGEAFLEAAVESALNQSFNDFEIIVIDDGSTDKTAEILNTLSPHLRIFSQQNKGAYAARNLGLQHAKGEYIAFLDSDDIWFPNRLALQVAMLNTDKELGLIYGDGKIVKSGQEENGSTFFQNGNKPERGIVFSQLVQRNFIPQSSVLVRYECFEKLGPFLEIPLAADYHKWLEISFHYKVEYIDEPIFSYFMHANNITNDRVELYRSRIKIFNSLISTIKNKVARPLLTGRIRELEYQLPYIYIWEGVRSLFFLFIKQKKETSMFSRIGYFLSLVFQRAKIGIQRLVEKHLTRYLHF